MRATILSFFLLLIACGPPARGRMVCVDGHCSEREAVCEPSRCLPDEVWDEVQCACVLHENAAQE